MATMVIPTDTAAQAAREDWVTPEHQLWELAFPRKIKRLFESKLGVIPANYIAQYLLDPKLTNWHTALQRLNGFLETKKIPPMFPEKIPPLPENIHQIMGSICPIYGRKTKRDGTRYKVSDTHLLYLLPSGTLNEFEARVKAYGQKYLAEYRNPLQFRYFHARDPYGTTQFNEPQWALMSKEVLPKSQGLWKSPNKSYADQAKLVATLSTRTLNYKVPTLRAAAGVALLHKVATGESILEQGTANRWYNTRVQETDGDGYHLAVGAFAPSGLHVGSDSFDMYIGVAGQAAV